MAPILKETDAASAAVTDAATPVAKAPSETPTRPQPVAIEIPISINGARTAGGSDKREPFSESCQTVLVFSHGAVIRVATPLVPGQLIFPTNEKSRKEVVCEVVKCKGSGTGSAYVEVQFTEPAPAFWGLRIPTGPAGPAMVAPPVPRPSIPAPPKSVPPAPPMAAKPVVPVPAVVPAVKPVVPPAAKEASAPQAPASEPVRAATPPASAGLRDHSKEIDALFDAPERAPNELATPATSEEKRTSASTTPSSEELKLQTARLQSQLSSILFAPTPASPLAPPAPAETPQRVVETTPAEPVATEREPKPASSPRKPLAPSFPVGEEVKIPAWLAPLSQNSDSSPAPMSASTDVSAKLPSETPALLEELPSEGAEPPSRPEIAVFGGQLLGESAQQDQAASTGSHKGLFIGVAAAVLLAAGGGAWYFQQARTVSATPISQRSVGPSPSTEPTSSSSLPFTAPDSSAALSHDNRASNPPSEISSQPLKNAAPVAVPAPVAAALELKNTTAAEKKTTPPAEPPKKPSLQVHLAAPVVKRGVASQAGSEALPSIDTRVSSVGTDALAAAGSTAPKEPSSPVSVGGDVKPAQLLKSVPPAYPIVARTQRVSGNVQLDALIDETGNVSSLKVISGPTLLHRAALDAVKQWKYSPAMLNGKPTAMHLTVTVQFRTQ